MRPAYASESTAMTIRPRRSVLYMPGSNARAMDKARTLPVDAVILDLEDSVAPDAKGVARQQVLDAVSAGGFGGREIIIRINGLDTSWWIEDVDVVAKARPDAVLVPKVSGAQLLEDLADRLVDISADHRIRVWAMMETPLAILHAAEIAAAAADVETRLAAFVMGTNDLARETRARMSAGRAPTASTSLMASSTISAIPRVSRANARRAATWASTARHSFIRARSPLATQPSRRARTRSRRRATSSPPSSDRRTGTRAWSRSMAAWSSACTPTWRGARSPFMRPLRRAPPRSSRRHSMSRKRGTAFAKKDMLNQRELERGARGPAQAPKPAARMGRCPAASQKRQENCHARNPREQRHCHPDHHGESSLRQPVRGTESYGRARPLHGDAARLHFGQPAPQRGWNPRGELCPVEEPKGARGGASCPGVPQEMAAVRGADPGSGAMPLRGHPRRGSVTGRQKLF